MPNSAKFWDKLAKKYAKQPIKDVHAYNQTMERTKAHLSKDDVVLEFGCGTGSTAMLLADNVDRITGSDISSNMIEIAKAKARDQQAENVTFVKGTLFDDTLEEESISVVLAFNILHLLEDLPTSIRRVNALLKPDGLFVSKTVCMAGNGAFLRVLIPIMRSLGLAPFVKILTIAELEDFITNAGFEIIETGVYPASPPSRFIVAKKI